MTHKTDCLRVYKCMWPMHRFGRAHDGGYVVALTSTVPDFLLSGGIENDCSFELDALRWYQGLVCDAYDPASGPAGEHSRYRFYRDRVPPLTEYGFSQMLVKLDIEGDEWPWLARLLPRERGQIAQLVVELHTPHGPRWDWDALARLAETHALIHAHGNNMDGIVEVDGVRVPGTLETTWLRRDLAGELELSSEPIPGPWDMPNDPNKPDHVVDWEPFVSL